VTVDVVIPAARGALLARLLGALEAAWRPELRDVVVAWDGIGAAPDVAGARLVHTGGGRGPAAARNAGWRASDATWIAFLDDDVLPPPDWGTRLLADLAQLPGHAAGVMGRVEVPVPVGRRPTDWERNVARLAGTPGIVTADCALRRAALEQVGGFDERFARAYREDTDIELRLRAAGWSVERGARRVVHPVRDARALVSLTLQRGNADDVLLWALHGSAGHVSIRTKARYALTVAAGLAGLAGSRTGRRAWLAETVRFTVRRARPGPKTAKELATLAVTSAAIPPLALWHTARGLARHRALVRRRVTHRT
jgi:glycosyltransferase involved in cell wall biosynthesis